VAVFYRVAVRLRQLAWRETRSVRKSEERGANGVAELPRYLWYATAFAGIFSAAWFRRTSAPFISLPLSKRYGDDITKVWGYRCHLRHFEHAMHYRGGRPPVCHAAAWQRGLKKSSVPDRRLHGLSCCGNKSAEERRCAGRPGQHRCCAFCRALRTALYLVSTSLGDYLPTGHRRTRSAGRGFRYKPSAAFCAYY